MRIMVDPYISTDETLSYLEVDVTTKTDETNPHKQTLQIENGCIKTHKSISFKTKLRIYCDNGERPVLQYYDDEYSLWRNVPVVINKNGSITET